MGQEQDYVGQRYGNGHRTSDQLKREVDHTRAEMDETIDALIARLDPAAMMSRAVRGIMGSGSHIAGKTSRKAGNALADVGETIFEKAKENPIPTALIAAGIAWMVMSRDKEEYEFFDEYEGHRRDGVGRKVKQAAQRAGSGMKSAASQTGSGLKAAASGVSHAAQSAVSGISHAAQSVSSATRSAASATRSGISQTASSMKHGASSMKQGVTSTGSAISSSAHDSAEGIRHAGQQIGRGARQLGEGARRGVEMSREGYEVAMRRWPLAVGGAALGIGLLCGLLLPETRREDEWMGRTRDDLLDKGKDLAKQATDRGREMAMATVEATQEKLKEEGLTPSELVSTGKRVVSEAQRAAQDTLREEGITPTDIKEKIERTAEEAASTAKAEAESKEAVKDSSPDSNRP